MADEVAFPTPRVDLRVVVVGAEVLVPGVGVGEQVPDDGQDRVADRDDGPALAAAAGQASVAFAEERVGPRDRSDDLAEGAGQPGINAAKLAGVNDLNPSYFRRSVLHEMILTRA